MRTDLLPDPAHVRARVHAAMYPREYRWGDVIRLGPTKVGVTYTVAGGDEDVARRVLASLRFTP